MLYSKDIKMRIGIKNMPKTDKIIKEKMDKLGYNQEDLAREIGITKEWVYDLINYPDEYETTLSKEQAIRLCKLLNIDISSMPKLMAENPDYF